MEEKIKQWEAIIPAVFQAENDLAKEWMPKLRVARLSDKKTRDEVADEYVHALAVHIVNHTSNE